MAMKQQQQTPRGSRVFQEQPIMVNPAAPAIRDSHGEPVTGGGAPGPSKPVESPPVVRETPTPASSKSQESPADDIAWPVEMASWVLSRTPVGAMSDVFTVGKRVPQSGSNASKVVQSIQFYQTGVVVIRLVGGNDIMAFGGYGYTKDNLIPKR